MTVRTSHKSVTFARSFSLSALDEVQAAGTYTVETHEELLPGLSFPAYRRIATLIFLPSRPGGTFVEQIVDIDPLELEAAQERMPQVRSSCSGNEPGPPGAIEPSAPRGDAPVPEPSQLDRIGRSTGRLCHKKA